MESSGSTDLANNVLARATQAFVKVSANAEEARGILVKALEHVQLLRPLLEFLNIFGDVQSIKKAEDRHAKLLLPHRSMSELIKRHAEVFLQKEQKWQDLILACPPAQSVMGAYPNARNQWAASYGVQPSSLATCYASIRTTMDSMRCFFVCLLKQAAYGSSTNLCPACCSNSCLLCEIVIEHTFREGNILADWMAKYGSNYDNFYKQ